MTGWDLIGWDDEEQSILYLVGYGRRVRSSERLGQAREVLYVRPDEQPH